MIQISLGEAKNVIVDALTRRAVDLFVDNPCVPDEFSICLYWGNDRLRYVFLSAEEIERDAEHGFFDAVIFESLAGAFGGYDKIVGFIAEAYEKSGLTCGNLLQIFLADEGGDLDDYVDAIDSHPAYADFLRAAISANLSKQCPIIDNAARSFVDEYVVQDNHLTRFVG